MIYITGDTHGDFTRFNDEEFLEQHAMTRDDYIIVTGDLGLLWAKNGNYSFNKSFLEQRNFTLLWVDGNHENFQMLNEFPITEWHGGNVHKILDNVIHLMRGQIYTINNKTFYTFGGARSIDKELRTPYVSWWPEEEATYAECCTSEENLEKYNYKVDYIITHGLPPTLISSVTELNTREDYNGASEKYLTNVYDKVQFQHWYCGHYHVDRDYQNISCLYNRIIPL